MNYTVFSNTPDGSVTQGMVKMIQDTGFGVEVRPADEMPKTKTYRKIPRVYYGDLDVGRFRGLRTHLLNNLVAENEKLRTLSEMDDDGGNLVDPERTKRWIEKSVPVTGQQIVEAIQNSGARRFQVQMLDRQFWTCSLEDWKEILEQTEVDDVRYISERRDCDDFAVALKGIVALKYGINAIAMVVDFTGKHAYNLIVVANPDGTFTAHALEPQTDQIDTDSRRVQFGKGAYKAEKGYVVF